MSYWIKDFNNNSRSFFLYYFLIPFISPLIWFIRDLSVVSDYVLYVGKFLSLYVLTYFSREAQKLGK